MMEPLMIALAFAAGFAVQLVKLPPLIGFLAAGFALNALGYERTAALDTIANLGVTLLLFTIGLKLDIKTLLKTEVWASASLHIVGSTLLLASVLFVLKLLGLAMATELGWTAMVLLGFALSFSSTVFAVKVLEDRSELGSLYGRIAIGILVMQDVFAVIFLSASSGQLPSPWALCLVLLWPAAKLMKVALDRVGHGDLQVLYGAFLSLVVGYSLFEAVGVKGDLGALIVGMLLASHPATAGLAKSLFHLKELFLVGFFLSVGLGALPDLTMVVMAGLLLMVLPLKSALYYLVLMRFGLRTRTGVLSTLALTNYSEFGLIVAAIAAAAGWLSPEWLVVISLALAASFVLAAPLNAASEALYARYKMPLSRMEGQTLLAADQPIRLGEVDAVVLGMGQIGSGAYHRLIETHGLRVLGVDNDPDKLSAHQAAGRRVIEGDAVDSDFWDKLVVSGHLKLVLLAMPSHAGNLYALQQLKHRAFAGRIAAIVKYSDEQEPLRALGADAVFHVADEAGTAFADDAVAGVDDSRTVQGA
ncbi:cation:proton antiporter family protein [Hydrogenophaga sp.]|uniref:cation:proton antiporter family protein n=1 Tax=Hydrogenophaga sp. TaxID=1904254 RepID=UPI00260F80BE|nr:cation:proton antiporter family protein [Hydrogenophaga sp.]MDM7950155.1 cation:proton antiporter [Hydrogenophaga sp.]